MTRHHPALVPALVAPGLVVATAIAAAAILWARPAHGQECRYQFQCPFVASPASAAPRARDTVARVRRVHHVYRSARPIRDTLTAADRAAEPEMPLVWPVEPPAVSDGEGRAQATLAAESTPRPSVSRRGEPSPTPWAHTDQGKKSILVAFVLFVAALTAGSFPRLNKGATA